MQANIENRGAREARTGSSGYLVLALLGNLIILSFQGWIVWWFSQRDNALGAMFVFMIFIGTLGFSLKVWFYATLAMVFSRSIRD